MHLLVDLDLVVGNLILSSKLELILWSYTILEYELVSSVVLEVECTLLLSRDDIADVVNLLCLQVLECRVRSQAVSLLCYDTLAIHLLNDTHWHHTWAEARYICLLLVLAEFCLNISSIVLLLNNDAKQCCTLLFLYFCNVHSVLSIILFVIFVFTYFGRKDNKKFRHFINIWLIILAIDR